MVGNRYPVTSRKDRTGLCNAENDSPHYIKTNEIPGFLHLQKNHVFMSRSEDTTFYLSHVKTLVSPLLLQSTPLLWLHNPSQSI